MGRSSHRAPIRRADPVPSPIAPPTPTNLAASEPGAPIPYIERLCIDPRIPTGHSAAFAIALCGRVGCQ